MSDERNVKIICKWTVPVAVNLYKIRDAKGEAGDFFRAVQKQRQQYQGFWIVSPEGKLIAAQGNFKNEKTWPQEVLDILEAALKEEVAKAPRHYDWKPANPFHGHGVQEDGSVNVAVFVRFVFGGKPSGPGAFDSVTLSAKEWGKFAPTQRETAERATGRDETFKVGQKWDLPDDIAKRLCKCLSPKSDKTNVPRPEELTEVEMHGVVQAIDGDIATLAYHGKLAAVHQHPFDKKPKTSRSQAKFSGFAKLNLKTNEMLTLNLAFDGTYHAFPPYHEREYTTFAGVEWTRDKESRVSVKSSR
ncbi:MAG: hypothetical protein HY040_18155 [Planctomycetes bacterium]|nr:hypothetical protein [Planctomycetota bacterium]